MAGIRHMATSTTAPKSELASAGDPPERSWRSFVLPAITLLLFLAATWAIHRELAAWTFADITAAVEAIPVDRLALAVLAGALSYAVLALYDPLALRHIGKPLPLRQAALAGFIGYAFSHAMGLPLLSGGAVRYRLYTAWGLGAGEIGGIVAFNSLTLWLGVAAMLCLGGLAAPAQVGALLHLAPGATLAVAAGLGALLAGYVAAGWLIRRPLTIRGWSFAWPSAPVALGQVALAVADWTLAALTLWILLPPIGLGFFAFAGIFTAACIAGVVSHVPAGLGVFEAVLLLALPDGAHAPGVAGALIAYRLIYYLLPLLVAALLFAVHQARAGSAAVAGRVDLARRGAALVLPNLLATLVFIGGAILLVSGATPTVADRLAVLAPVAPLALIEVSHFLGSLAGLALLVLALGLRRRLDGAWWMACVVISAGIVLSLVKGIDWEEALYLAIVLAALLPSRKAFYRKSRLLEQRLSVPWLCASFAVIVGSIWLGFFCYRHVEYGHELWWQFLLEGDAPRFLRATAGVMIATALIGALQLVRFAAPHHPSDAPDSEAIELAAVAMTTAERAPSERSFGPARRQALPVQRQWAQLRHVRRAGPQLGRHGRADRDRRRALGAAVALSRALRPVGRPHGVLRDRPRGHARPGRARPHLLQARRAGLRAAGRVQPRRIGPIRVAPGRSACGARRRRLQRGGAGGSARPDTRAACGLGRLAGQQERPGKGLLPGAL